LAESVASEPVELTAVDAKLIRRGAQLSDRCTDRGIGRVSVAVESKTTFPLAMNVETFAKPSPSNSVRRRSIFTTWPPTLMARRNAT
jgi:hypothetical protein